MTGMRARSAKTAARDRAYLKAARAFLEAAEGCAGAGLLPVECAGSRGLQVHHAKGRVGSLMMDQRYWRPLCGPCHGFVTDHPAAAREAGLSFHRNAVES